MILALILIGVKFKSYKSKLNLNFYIIFQINLKPFFINFSYKTILIVTFYNEYNHFLAHAL